MGRKKNPLLEIRKSWQNSFLFQLCNTCTSLWNSKKKSFNQVCFLLFCSNALWCFLPWFLKKPKSIGLYSYTKQMFLYTKLIGTSLNIWELPISHYFGQIKTNLFDFYFCFYLQTKCSPRIFGWSRLFVGIFISCALPKCSNYSNSTQVCSNHKGTISCASFHFQYCSRVKSRVNI